MLAIVGVNDFSPDQARRCLEWTGEAFDLAVHVSRGPSPFDFKLRAHLRPYLVDGYEPLIRQDSRVAEVLGALGISDSTAWPERLRGAVELRDALLTLADEVVGGSEGST